MALPKLFQLITWHNNTTPAINEDNLNAMSEAIDGIDDRVISLAGTLMEDLPVVIEGLENLDDAVTAATGAATSAQGYANTASTNATTAGNKALDSEAWACGTRNGQAVPSTDPTYHNNSKYWSAQSAGQTLDGLRDVDIDDATLATGQVPVYNATTEKWENGEVMATDGSNSSSTGVTFSRALTVGTRVSESFVAQGSFAQGNNNSAESANSHAEGTNTTASNLGAHSEGWASGTSASVGGGYCRIIASGEGAHAEGHGQYNRITASGHGSHAEGRAYQGGEILASGWGSHAEGASSAGAITASGVGAHAEGYGLNTATGNGSHVEGVGNTAGYDYQHVSGKYNDNKTTTLLEIGNGTAANARSNAFEVYSDGSLSTNNGTTKTKLPTIKSATLTAGATTVSFTNMPTTGTHLIDFYTSVLGLDYTEITTSDAGATVVLTYEAQSANVTVYAKIVEVM